MNSIRISVRRAGSLFAAAALVLSAAVPAMVSAATVTERSIELSSSVKAATGVTYHVEFTSPSNTKDFVLDFCTTAAIGAACTAVPGLDVENVAVSTADTADYSVADIDANTAAVTLTNAGTSVDVELTGITNPTDSGVFYARITTYAAAHNYTGPLTANLGTVVDEGTVALSATDGFGVSGTVAETMTFCASGAAITQADCSDASDPSIELGTDGVLGTELSEGTVYTQISTNAVGGAIVNLKSDAAGCGGLLRDGTGSVASRCGIAPVTGTPALIDDNDALFGLRLGGLSATTGTIAASGLYETTNHFMNYDADDEATGVTSPYGDPVYNTSNGPVDLGKANLIFGANISNVTAAGNYSATLSLIATGKF